MHLTIGTVAADSWRGCHGEGAAPLPTEPTPGSDIRTEHPLYGKSVCFTGALAIPRRAAPQAVVDRGARVTRGVTKETEILVTGYQDLTYLAAGQTKSNKLRHAEELQAGGQALNIITEADLVQLLPDVDSLARGGVRVGS